jgi:hypothetical protein
MKTKLKTMVFLCFFAGMSCEKKEDIATNVDPCLKGKLLYPWCSTSPYNLVVIQILDTPIGGDFTAKGITYKNAVLANLDKSLSDNSTIWDEVISSSDSIFYFRYVKKSADFGVCEVCCPPKNNIRITSFLSSACSVSNQ